MDTNYQIYEERLQKIARDKGFLLEIIGQSEGLEKFNIYKLTINQIENPKRTICIVAGIHGSEISGPLGILSFLEDLDMKKIGENKIIILPNANPYGYHHNKYRNHNGANLNRHFKNDESLKYESRALLEAIIDEKIDIFCTLHEDDEQDAFYLHAYSQPQRTELQNMIFDCVKGKVKILDKDQIYGLKVKNAVIYNYRDGSFEDRMSREGVSESICVEIPDSIHTKDMTNIAKEIVEKVTAS